MSTENPSYEGRVALVTGAARGQGRAHALAFAQRGADLVICDRCSDAAGVGYPLGTEQDLTETARQIEALGRRVVSQKIDTGIRADLEALIAHAEEELGHIDIAVANAGVSAISPITDHAQEVWDDVVSANLTGVFNTLAAVAPGMAARGYGRIVTISSMLGRRGAPGQTAYCASKWGVIGMSKAAAAELAPQGVTVNVVAPGNIDTPMVRNDGLYRVVRPDLEEPTWDDVAGILQQNHAVPVAVLDPSEVTRAVLFLTDTANTYITGTVIPVDAGAASHNAA